MEELQTAIQTYFGTNAELSHDITRYFRSEVLKKDEFHTRQGSWRSNLSFVQTGYLRIYRPTEKKEATQWISSPGEFCTDLNTLLFDQPARWEIQALTDCQLMTLDKAAYSELSTKFPEWQQIERLFVGKCFITIEERVFSFISMTAEERYAFFLENRPDLFQQVPQQYIASILGMTPETFSRIRRKVVS